MKRIAMTDENWATAIKIAAVLVAVPRWIGALLEADGAALLLTDQTRYWWGLFSAMASAGMALVEGVAFWYTLRAWRQHGGKLLGALIALSMAAFAVVLTPYIMANVTGAKLAQVLSGNWLVAWSSCVSLSTILIVASVGYAQPRKQEQAAPQALDEDCHCPICYSVISLPVWLHDQHGDKYLAYCDKCQRAYAESEVVWSQVGASVPQPVTAHVDKPAQPDSNLSESSASGPEKPALLRPTSPKAPRAHAPSRDLTDFDVLKLWRAHGQADAWQQVSDIVSECLNGNTPDLKAWYDGKRSIAGLTTALGMDAAQAKRTGALVRGLIKPSEDQKVIDTDSK